MANTDEVMDSNSKQQLEKMLDEADLQAKNEKTRLTHDIVFTDLRKQINQ